MTRLRCDGAPAWGQLKARFKSSGKDFDARKAFAADVTRFASFSQQAPHVFADLSKNLIDGDTEKLLLDLARQTGVEAHRDAMFAGEAINTTEQRAVMHWLLRAPLATRDMAAESAQVHATLGAMLTYADKVRSDDAITDIVNIGIGGSDLGPQMAVLALDEFAVPTKRFHFVSNVDGHELAALLRRVKPQSTLFLIASKTFTTIETMTNAQSAKAWFKAKGGSDIARHFAALTTNVAAANAFGIPLKYKEVLVEGIDNIEPIDLVYAKDLGYEFDGVHAPANSKDHYSLAYSQFIMPLVKGMQEQQVIIESQKSDIEILKQQVEELTKAFKALNEK